MEEPLNKTASPDDLAHPEVRAAARGLKRLVRRMWWRRMPFALNGVLRTRWRIRWHKLWEYSRGLAWGGFEPGMRVLDFGGGATIPVFHLAREGCEVLSLDVDPKLADYTNLVAARRGWSLRGSTHDLTQAAPPAEWGLFHRVISYCVIEHIPKDLQAATMGRLASLLEPGGMLEMTFDFGEDAPTGGAIRDAQEVAGLVEASGLRAVGNREFVDTGERFVLDKRHPDNRFTFGSLFLRKEST